MLVYFEGHDYHFECENLCRVFYPYSKVQRIENSEQFLREQQSLGPLSPEPPREQNDLSLYAAVKKLPEGFAYTVQIRERNRTAVGEETAADKNEYTLVSLVFRLFCELTGYRPYWGLLTGIHPVKLLREYIEREGEEPALDIFRNRFFVQEKKLDLARETLRMQVPTLQNTGENDYSLYISVPFCPSRCSYCSFISQDVKGAGKLLEPYFDLLLLELRETAKIADSLGLRLISVYVGGGTPTTFSAKQLAVLCEELHLHFDMDACAEFTVEAGRPDTIDAEKLKALKEGGVTRISINPQSMNEDVLRNIGRSHTPGDIEQAYQSAREAGFTSINSDLIVGLPGDTLPGFQHTLDTVLRLGASNVTVHSLALKRSAAMSQGGDVRHHQDAELAGQMADHAQKRLQERGFAPYYLYRQSRMAGNLENTGYALPGDICRYNIYTMDESSTVIACGAGGVSKLKDPYSGRLERIFNFKYPYEYISRNDEILHRKKGVITLYEQFRQRLH